MNWCESIPIKALVYLFFAIPALAMQDQPDQRDAPSSQSVGPQDGSRDTLRVAYPLRFATESDYLAWVSRRADALELAAAEAPGVPREIELLLAAGNRLLGSGTEHAATTRILGVEQDEMPDAAKLAALFERVGSFFERAGERLAEHQNTRLDDGESDEEEDAAEQVWAELVVRRQTLQAFARALRAYLLNSGSEEDAREMRQAASELSMPLESNSPPIAAAARLWQAVLRSSEEDPSRTLSILGPITAPPRVGSQPYRFFGAVLHVRLLARHRSPTIALAMLMRVEELVETWLSGQRQRGQALRTCAFARVGILQDWLVRLSGRQGREGEVAWCQGGILTLQEEWLTGEMPRLLRLSPAIPFLVAPDDLGVEDLLPGSKGPDGP